ncbi:NADPH-dependent 3-demethoxyubiquinone 3-hydroxylase, mitochondrial isoform 3-T3 [Callospermophilus lateralis]|uniref:NADPH-dependent 3-demethoxyubiquinone 3-hydroxylase, mitochondrial isoform X3 n=1 Tax=Callospermophilus lateralis TaxID=76772 RepID=UPI004038AB40
MSCAGAAAAPSLWRLRLGARRPLSACRGRVGARARSSGMTLDNVNRAALDRIIRVDHAGEYGANRIYAGQMAVLGRTSVGPVIQGGAAALQRAHAGSWGQGVEHRHSGQEETNRVRVVFRSHENVGSREGPFEEVQRADGRLPGPADGSHALLERGGLCPGGRDCLAGEGGRYGLHRGGGGVHSASLQQPDQDADGGGP